MGTATAFLDPSNASVRIIQGDVRKGFATSLLLAGTFMAAILVGGCGGNARNAVVTAEGVYRGSEPPGGISMPAFSLRDVLTGASVESADLRGRVVLVTFVDTDCHDKCPLLASAMGEALRLLPESVRQQTSALAISVNPLIDKRPSVRRFLRERRAQALTYVSGSIAEMKPVWNRFGVVSAYETGDADTHSADVRVFDPRGMWVSTQHAGVDLTPENLAHDVELALGR